MTSAFLTNATGPAIVVEAFAPLLAKSNKTPRIVNVSTGAGSIGLRLDYANEHQKRKVVSPLYFNRERDIWAILTLHAMTDSVPHLQSRAEHGDGVSGVRVRAQGMEGFCGKQTTT